MNNQDYLQKVAEHYYQLGQEYASKTANLNAVTAVLDSANVLADGVQAARDPKKVGKAPSKAKRLTEGGKQVARSLFNNYYDPALPKNESAGDAALNIVSDLASIVTTPSMSLAPVARTAQRYAKMVQRTSDNMQKRFNKGGLERKAVETYIQAHPKFNL